MKKTICALLSVLLLLSAAIVTVSAEGISVNAKEVELYFLDDGYEDVLSIPSGLRTSFRIEVKGADRVRYEVIGDDIITVDSSGMIQPKQEEVYVVGSVSGGVSLRYYYTAGTSVVRVTAGAEIFDITVTVRDYADYYVDRLLDDFISKNITSSMTDYQKLEKIAQYVSSRHYSVYYSSGRSLFIFGEGDCWAFTGGVMMLAEKLGFTAWARNANRDPGAGSGHMNAMVKLPDGSYYEVECSIGDGVYFIDRRTSLFSYRSYGSGIEVYQYDGDEVPSTLEIPRSIDGKTVVAVGEEFAFRNYNYRYIEEVILPDTITTLAKSAFNSCDKLKKINLPASLEYVGPFAFTLCTSLTDIQSESEKFPVENGVIYNEDKTVLLSAPAVSEVTIPESVTEIGYYAFYYNSNLQSVVIPETVQVIAEGAFGDCSNLSRVTFAGDAYERIDDFAFAMCTALTRIQLPASVETMGDHVFYNCWNLSAIYCEAESQPEGWDAEWLSECNAKVYWGEEMPALAPGDLSGDGQVSATDYMLLKRAVLKTFALSAEQKAVADVNRDGVINALDYMLVKRHVLGTFKIA